MPQHNLQINLDILSLETLHYSWKMINASGAQFLAGGKANKPLMYRVFHKSVSWGHILDFWKVDYLSHREKSVFDGFDVAAFVVQNVLAAIEHQQGLMQTMLWTWWPKGFIRRLLLMVGKLNVITHVTFLYCYTPDRALVNLWYVKCH